jgi:hypothetical protein
LIAQRSARQRHEKSITPIILITVQAHLPSLSFHSTAAAAVAAVTAITITTRFEKQIATEEAAESIDAVCMRRSRPRRSFSMRHVLAHIHTHTCAYTV